MSFRGAIFDVDGVLVDSPHELAWREDLKDLLEGGWSGVRAEAHGLELVPGKLGWELRPAVRGDKGEAVRRLVDYCQSPAWV
jgi:beta-phosphoglucomutase-like phosphatase (HAD superfamily)